MKTFQLPAGLEGYRSLKDRTLKLTFETGEMSPEQMANIHFSLNKIGWLAFSPDPFATHELDEIDKMRVEFDDTSKTPAQRLRGVLYRNWEISPEGYKVFNDFYNAKYEIMIKHWKKPLP